MAVDSQITDLLALLMEEPNPRAPWALNGDGVIRRTSDSDENYFRKRIWDASKREKRRLTIWCYDNHQFRDAFQIVASTDMLPEIGKGLSTLYPKCRAFMLYAQRTLVVFWLDGQVLSKPVALPAMKGENPTNDTGFMAGLSEKLDEISKSHGASNPVSFKAWVHSKTGKIVRFGVGKKFEDQIAADPASFGVREAKNVLQARIMAERAGWVACGVNAEDPKRIVAVVQALNDEMAIEAAAFFSEHGYGDRWSVLKVRTNDSKHDFKSANEIAEFLKTTYL
jgi:hypothetical protein